VLALALVGLALTPAAPRAGRLPSNARAIGHALNRLGFGPRPGDVDRIARLGLAVWIETQLQPSRISDAALDERLARLTTIGLPPETISSDYVRPAREARRQRLRQGQENAGAGGSNGTSPMVATGARSPQPGRGRQVLAELSEAKLLRAVYSQRQLEEVLVDFWFNHFNVFARKGPVEIYIGEYEREAIRPHVLGRFRDLLGATAKSPAMLVYLDNWMSVDPQAEMRPAARRQTQPATAPEESRQRRTRGLNENYARELLELHTLGVDGGYTQQDVVAVARAFTGWTIGRPGEGAGFRFAPRLHDRSAKVVLGHTIPEGGGIDDGERVLDILASHPSTARHIATKLAQRFVADTPPAALVDRAAAAFRDTHGDLREVVRTLVTSAEFFADSSYRAKVKTPFEYVASALRATEAEIERTPSVLRALATLGMPLYLCQPPTGYDDTADAWLSSGALVNRLNLAVALTSGELGGVHLPRLESTPNAARERIVRDALGGDLSQSTDDTIRRASTAAQSIALAIGSPEFQRQ
jgi:uncharacterized protein (DUF1800 family)